VAARVVAGAVSNAPIYGAEVVVEGNVVWRPSSTSPLSVSVHDCPPTPDLVRRIKREGGWHHVPDVMVLGPGALLFRHGGWEPLSGQPPYIKRETPGVRVATHKLPILLVVEIDGSVHDAKATKTESRDLDYERAGLDYIRINKADCESVGRSWKGLLRYWAGQVLGGHV